MFCATLDGRVEAKITTLSGGQRPLGAAIFKPVRSICAAEMLTAVSGDTQAHTHSSQCISMCVCVWGKVSPALPPP